LTYTSIAGKIYGIYRKQNLEVFGLKMFSKILVCLLVVVAFTNAVAVASTQLEVVICDVPSAWKTEGQEAYSRAKEDFEKAYPDIKINIQYRSWGTTYLDYIITSAAAGALPDVFQMGGNQQGQFFKAGLILPLDNFVNAWGQFNDFPPGVRDDVTVDGKIVGLPYRADVRLMLYNKEDFDAVGLNRNIPPTNWEELISYGKKLNKRASDGQFERVGFRTLYSDFYSPVWQAGGDFITEANGKSVITIDTPATREGLEFIQKLYTEYQIASTASRSANGTKWGMEYGTASMELRPEGQIRSLRDDKGIQLGIGGAMKYKETAELVFINKWAIGSQTKDVEAAWKWVEFVSDRRRVSELQYATAGLPPRRSVSQIEPWVRDTDYRTVFEVMAYTRPLPGAKYINAPGIRTSITTLIKNISAGTTSVPAAIEKAKGEITLALADE
jgi:ABC-type glycerol-3-phosphate transport system substrate-binding protein